jgi:integrase
VGGYSARDSTPAKWTGGNPCAGSYRFICLVGTGLRAGELLGLRAHRVDLARRRLEVLEVRYEAGRFGRGYKNRPKRAASIRVVPLADPVADAERPGQRRIPTSCG